MRMRLALIIYKFFVPTRNVQKSNQLKPLINLYFVPVWFSHAIVYFLSGVKWGHDGHWLKQKQELKSERIWWKWTETNKRQITFKLLTID